MTLAGQVGGWDTGPESVGEDMHMFLKCYFKTKGQCQVKIIYSPASQSNVHSDAKGIRGTYVNLNSRYKQALRHMWGSLDSGYAVQKGFEALWNKNDEKLSEWLQGAAYVTIHNSLCSILNSYSPEERVPRWVNDSNLTHFTPPNLYETDNRPSRAKFNKVNLFLVYHRLFEAHFLPLHLTIALLSGVIYGAVVSPLMTNSLLLWSLGFCGTLRFIGFCGTCVFLYLYESYHGVCVKNREDEMKRAGLWEDMQDGFAHRSWKKNFTDYCAIPVNGVLFAAAPALVAEICHFWTDQLVYHVSAKPQLKKAVERLTNLA